MIHPINIGDRFTRLVVISILRKNYLRYAVCHCDCGQEKIVRVDGLYRGAVLSCGCLNRDRAWERGRVRIQNKPLEKRFWEKVNKTNECWLWTGSIDGAGYGLIRLKGRSEKAHRVSYILVYGSIPNNQCVLHHCDNRICVRPEHLFIGSKKDNTQDAIRKGRFRVSRLTLSQISAIQSDPRRHKEVAADYGLTPQYIGQLRHGDIPRCLRKENQLWPSEQK